MRSEEEIRDRINEIKEDPDWNSLVEDTAIDSPTKVRVKTLEWVLEEGDNNEK